MPSRRQVYGTILRSHARDPAGWLANVLFGVYVRRVPYNVVYGGLAAVIGLIIWMQLSAVIIFLGAAWNAELEERREAVRTRG
jgi:membrane protein